MNRGSSKAENVQGRRRQARHRALWGLANPIRVAEAGGVRVQSEPKKTNPHQGAGCSGGQ